MRRLKFWSSLLPCLALAAFVAPWVGAEEDEVSCEDACYASETACYEGCDEDDAACNDQCQVNVEECLDACE